MSEHHPAGLGAFAGAGTQPQAEGVAKSGTVETPDGPIAWSIGTDGMVKAAGGGQELTATIWETPDGGSHRGLAFSHGGGEQYLTIEGVTNETLWTIELTAAATDAQLKLVITDIDENVTSGSAKLTGWVTEHEAVAAGDERAAASDAALAPFPGAVAISWTGTADLAANPLVGTPIPGWPPGVFDSELREAAFFDAVTRALVEASTPHYSDPSGPGHVIADQTSKSLGKGLCTAGGAMGAGIGALGVLGGPIGIGLGILVVGLSAFDGYECNELVDQWQDPVTATPPNTDIPTDEEPGTHVTGTSQDDPPPPPPDEGNGNGNGNGGDVDPNAGDGGDGTDGPDLGDIDPGDGGEGGGGGGGGNPDLEDPGHEQD